MDANALWWTMPGPADFIRRAVDTTLGSDGGVFVIQTPAKVPGGFLEILRSAVESRSDYYRLVTIDVNGRTEPPIRLMTETLTSLNETAGTIDDLLAEDELTDTVFFIHGMTPAQWQQWGLFARAFETERTRTKAISAPRILFTITARIPYSSINVFKTEAMMLLGASSRIDTELFVTMLLGKKPKTLAKRIAHATIVDIAAWNADLASFLASESVDTQLNPLPALLALGAGLPGDAATWANGAVDLWDGRQYAHSVITALDDETSLKRRIWLAQSRIFYNLFDEVLARATTHYEALYQKCFPITKKALGKRPPKIITEIGHLELQDLHWPLRKFPEVPLELVQFLETLAEIRTNVAHTEASPPELIQKVSKFWEYIDTYLPDTLHGWDWPACGQTLTIMVGPACAGKSTYVAENYAADAVISSDQIRQQWYGTLENTTSHETLFRHIRKQAILMLRRGRSVVIDATHLEQWERMITSKIVPPQMPVTYVVINRPMDEKLVSQGWRESRPGLLQKHEATFQRELKNILAGDGLGNVTVRNYIRN